MSLPGDPETSARLAESASAIEVFAIARAFGLAKARRFSKNLPETLLAHDGVPSEGKTTRRRWVDPRQVPGIMLITLTTTLHPATDLVAMDRLRARGLGRKRSLALREFALGVEALRRFVRREPLRRVHECVFGVLALESESVDPRL